jgi:hypothetical protein
VDLSVPIYSLIGVVMWFSLPAENDPHDGKRKCEALWPIFRISHQKSRYIYDLYYRRKEISKELYEFCLDQGYADRNLIAKWKKVGDHTLSIHALFWWFYKTVTGLLLSALSLIKWTNKNLGKQNAFSGCTLFGLAICT